MRNKQPLKLSLLIVSMAFLANCDFLKDSSAEVEKKQAAIGSKSTAAPAAKAGDDSKVLLKIDGQPAITENEFDAYKKQFADAQPQYAAFFEDPTFEEQLFQGFINEKLLDRWISAQGVDKKPEYQKELADIMDFGRRTLNVKYFQEAHPATVTDADVKKFYDENKQSPQFMTDAGGVAASAVMFDTQAAAQAFYDKVKANPAQFTADATADNLKVKDLGDVNQHSFNVEGPLREKLLSLKSFPTVDVVKVSDKSYAVVYATGKNDPKYVDYDQVKEPINNMLKQQKTAENMMEKLKGLESNYTLEKSDHFEQKKAARDTQVKAATQQANNNKSVQAEAPVAVTKAPTAA